MAFEIRKATRKAVKARVAFVGPSGAGKTYSSILFARGLVGPAGRVILIDTERSSSEMYSDLAGGFDVLPLSPPYSPARYRAAMRACVEAGADAVVIDQISHAWTGPGGVLEFVDMAKSSSGSAKGFSAWKDATPMQAEFIEEMLGLPCHLVVTMRSKAEWVIEKDDRGKQVPRKIGMAPVQRDGIEFEFQTVLDLSTDGNVASVSKDRTGTLSGRLFRPSIADGAAFAAFLAGGEPLAPQAPRPGADEQRPEAPEVAEPAQNEGPVVSPGQAKALFTKAKALGVPLGTVKTIMREFAGVEQSAAIPLARYDAVLAAVEVLGNVPAGPAA